VIVDSVLAIRKGLTTGEKPEGELLETDQSVTSGKEIVVDQSA
jgi:hypothetical protein